MDLTYIKDFAQLGGTVVTVVLFLRYLTTRDNKWSDLLKSNSDSNVALAKALQKLTDKIEANSNVNMRNTSKINENLTAVKDNTESIKKNTEIISNGNGNH